MNFITHWQKYGCVLWFFWNWTYLLRSIKKTKDKSVNLTIFRIQSDEPIMCEFFLYCFHRMCNCRKNSVRLYQFLFSYWLSKVWQDNKITFLLSLDVFLFLALVFISCYSFISLEVGLKIWAITAAVKKYRSIIKKKWKSTIKWYC